MAVETGSTLVDLQVVLDQIARQQIPEERGREILEDRLSDDSPTLLEKFLASLAGR